MARKPEHTFMGDFRNFFLRGLAILLPTLLTVGILLWAWGFLSKNIAEPINRGVRTTFIWAAPRVIGEQNMPGWYQVSEEELTAARRAAGSLRLSDAELLRRVRREGLRDYWDTAYFGLLDLIGVVVAVVMVYLAGVLVGNLIGRRAYAKVESWLVRIPLVKQVYPNVKQVTDFLVGGGEGKKAIQSGSVCLVEYPRKGIWTVGLMTGETLKAIEHIAGEPCVTVFIPSSPTPFTGYTITVAAREVYALPLSMDETIRFVVSGGVLVPENQRGGVPQINEGELPPGPRSKRLGAGSDLAGGAGGPMMGGSSGEASGGQDRASA